MFQFSLRWLALVSLVVLNSCGQGGAPASSPSLAAAGPQAVPNGNYQVSKILCDGEESTVVTSALLAAPAGQGISVSIQFNSGSGVRTTNFFGCLQTVPMSPVTFSAPNSLNITDNTSSCVSQVSGACTPLTAACATAPFSYQSPYQIQGSSLTIQIPLNPNQSSPCGASQGTSDIEFVMNQI